jgi:hypothetical protein
MAVLIAAQMKSTVVYGSARRATINGREEKVAAFSISRVTRLSLDDYFYERNTKKYNGERALATVAPFSPSAINALSLRYCGFEQILYVSYVY